MDLTSCYTLDPTPGYTLAPTPLLHWIPPSLHTGSDRPSLYPGSTQLSLASRGEDWASQGHPKGKADAPTQTPSILSSEENSPDSGWDMRGAVAQEFGAGGASSRAEGLLFLHGLESNPGSSLQTEEEAGLP